MQARASLATLAHGARRATAGASSAPAARTAADCAVRVSRDRAYLSGDLRRKPCAVRLGALTCSRAALFAAIR